MIPAIPFEEPGDLAQYTVDELHAIVGLYQRELAAAGCAIDLWERNRQLTLEYLRDLGLDKVATSIEQGAHYMRVWKTGEKVEIVFGARTVTGLVKLASANGRSLMLEFDGLLATPDGGAYGGMMPVLEEAGVFRDLITRTIVELNDPKEG